MTEDYLKLEDSTHPMDQHILLKNFNESNAIEKKQQNQKQFNDFINVSLMIEEIREYVATVNSYLKTLDEAQYKVDIEKNQLHEQKAKEFLRNLEIYYADKDQLSKQALDDLENNKEKIESQIENTLKEIQNKKNEIHDSWNV